MDKMFPFAAVIDNISATPVIGARLKVAFPGPLSRLVAVARLIRIRQCRVSGYLFVETIHPRQLPRQRLPIDYEGVENNR